MQPTQQPSTTSLQGGSSSLQPQDTSTQYQQTGGVGQDALGPEQYQNYDNLSVQGTPSGSTSTAAVAAGNNSPEAILLVSIMVVLTGILVLRKFIPRKNTKTTSQESAPVDVTESSNDGSLNAANISQKSTKTKKKKSNKKAPSKVKKPTKKAKKSGKK